MPSMSCARHVRPVAAIWAPTSRRWESLSWSPPRSTHVSGHLRDPDRDRQCRGRGHPLPLHGQHETRASRDEGRSSHFPYPTPDAGAGTTCRVRRGERDRPRAAHPLLLPTGRAQQRRRAGQQPSAAFHDRLAVPVRRPCSAAPATGVLRRDCGVLDGASVGDPLCSPGASWRGAAVLHPSSPPLTSRPQAPSHGSHVRDDRRSPTRSEVTYAAEEASNSSRAARSSSLGSSGRPRRWCGPARAWWRRRSPRRPAGGPAGRRSPRR